MNYPADSTAKLCLSLWPSFCRVFASIKGSLVRDLLDLPEALCWVLDQNTKYPLLRTGGSTEEKHYNMTGKLLTWM